MVRSFGGVGWVYESRRGGMIMTFSIGMPGIMGAGYAVGEGKNVVSMLVSFFSL